MTDSQWFHGVALSAVLLVGASIAPAADIDGLVTTTNGVPIAGIDLDIFEHVTGEPVTLLDDDTDGDGNFDIIIPDGRYRVRFQPDLGIPLVAREFVYYALVGNVDWTVQMETGITLSGVVQTPGGSPVVGAEIQVTRTDTEVDIYSPFDETDASGAFAIFVPADAPFHIVVEPPAGTAWLGTETEVAGSTTNIDLGTLSLTAGNVVTGRVTSGGVGVERVNLDAFRPDGSSVPLGHDRTDVSGDFTIILPDGEYDLVARPRVQSGLATARMTSVTISGPTSVGTIATGPGSALRGTTTFAGAGVGDVRLRLETPAGVFVDTGFRTSNSAGDFELIVPAGTYTVIGDAPPFRGFAPAVVESVALTSDATVDLVFEVGTPIRGLLSFHAEGIADGVEISWVAIESERVLSYRLVRHDTGGVTFPVAVLGATDGDPRPGSSRAYRVIDPDGARGSSYSLEARLVGGVVETEGPIDVGLVTTASTPLLPVVHVQPHPARASEAVRISAEASPEMLERITAWDIFDVAGRRLARVAAHDGVAAVPAGTLARLSAGVYLISSHGGPAPIRGRLVLRAR